MTAAPTRTDVLAAMERDVAEAMRRHMPAYFAAGAPGADTFMAELARPLYAALVARGLEHLRGEDGAPLDPPALHSFAFAAFLDAAPGAIGITNRTPEPVR
jgi:hypothetical protein